MNQSHVFSRRLLSTIHEFYVRGTEKESGGGEASDICRMMLLELNLTEQISTQTQAHIAYENIFSLKITVLPTYEVRQ